ncbi:MAG: hypothetical protein CTY35_03810 [Methylotenera sp.]|nr:MAG: hypothetical protein CTY35_03810 [Methylotenera sp.]
MTNAYIPIGKLFNVKKGELQSTKCTPGEYAFITAAEDWKTHENFAYECEALVFAAAASGSLGRTHYVDGKFTASDLCFVLTVKDAKMYPINMQFYHFVFNSLKNAVVKATKSGTSKESINQSNFNSYQLPYFDIVQQDLWIDKLKNTLVKKDLIINELNKQQGLLKKLRKQILQEAIEGKLSADWRANNPKSEPASEVLKRIKAEKIGLYKKSQQYSSQQVEDQEKLFKIPSSWEWCRLGDIVLSAKDGPHESPEYSKSGIPFISTRNISTSGINFSSSKFISKQYHEILSKKCKPEKGDILYTKGGTTGVACVNTYDIDFNVWVHVAVLKKPVSMNSFYIQHVLNSPHCHYQSQKYTHGIGNQDLGLTRMIKITTPLPPYAEQEFIVEKIERLFKMCDQLEARLDSNQAYTEDLMQSVLKEAFTHEIKILEPVDA